MYWTPNKISYSQIKVRCRYDQDNQIKHYETEASTGNIYRAMKQKIRICRKEKVTLMGNAILLLIVGLLGMAVFVISDEMLEHVKQRRD